MNWEEICEYYWLGRLSGTTYKYKVEHGWLKWSRLDEDLWTSWVPTINAPSPTLMDSYIRLEANHENSTTSHQERVCQKIKLMEKRWLSFQERKHDVQCRG